MRWMVLGVLVLASGAQAETITFEADGEARFIRCVDMFGTASCEMIFPSDRPDTYYACVALDPADQPLASTTGMPGVGVLFQDLDAKLVDRVVCQGL